MLRHVSSPFLKFSDYLLHRRSQAEKSLLIQVSGANSVWDVHSFLTSKFGPLTSLFHYTLSTKSKYAPLASSLLPPSPSAQSPQSHWVLAEFNDLEHLTKALKTSGHAEGNLPFHSSMCFFRQPPLGSAKSKYPKTKLTNYKVITERLDKSPDLLDFSKTKSLNAQILMLENSLKITELGVRVRFLLARHLEESLERFFPEGCVLPFGSTVSGIGRLGGDLDLVLLTNKSEIFPKYPSGAGVEGESPMLWFQTKLYTMGTTTQSRFQVQRVMETVADVLQLFVPGCTQLQRILQARVPILRFWSEYTDTQCDLSMTNSTGIHMSELIYIMTSLNNHFVSLLFTIRAWASARNITNPNPGRQPTNFMLVLLLIHFLQSQKILPTLDTLFNNPREEDQRTTLDGIPCTFLRDPERILTLFTPQNEEKTPADLLYDFFEFYSEFDFASRGVSLFTGGAWGKPDGSPMYIQNPLERHLNVARNVSKEEISRLKSECCAALWKLEASITAKNENVEEDKRKRSSQRHFQNISLQEILLTPQLQQSKNKGQEWIRIKDVLID